MLLVTARYFRVIEESNTLRSKLLTLRSRFQLHIFYNILQLQYVEIENYDSNQMMSDISLAHLTVKIEL